MTYLGIDVSKQTLDCCLISDGIFYVHKTANSKAGFDKLIKWLADCQAVPAKVHACCEATGTYYEAMTEYLTQAGVKVSVENPRKIKGFGIAVLQRNKTDKQDAELIARYCKALEPPAWQQMQPEQKEMQDLIRYIARLKRQLAAEKTKYQESPEYLQKHISKTIKHLAELVQATQKELKACYKGRTEQNSQHKRLKTIPGIGDYTAAVLQTVLHDGKRFQTANQLAAYLGLDPRQYQSGSSVKGKTRISKVGNKYLRASLYMSGVVAYRTNAFPRFIGNLQKNGKKPNQIIVALMRKIATTAFYLLKYGQDFDKSKHI